MHICEIQYFTNTRMSYSNDTIVTLTVIITINCNSKCNYLKFNSRKQCELPKLNLQ